MPRWSVETMNATYLSKGGRDLRTLIGTVRQFIPDEFKDVHADLAKVSDSLLYTSPELMPHFWQEACDAMESLPEPTENAPTWVKVVVAIWLDQQYKDGGWSSRRAVDGFMCKVDWDYELGQALGGNTIYPSKADLLANHNCAECGMVEVQVLLKEVVQESDFSIKPEKTYNVSIRKEDGTRSVEKITGAELLKRNKK
jgi:hypothetical protein